LAPDEEPLPHAERINVKPSTSSISTLFAHALESGRKGRCWFVPDDIGFFVDPCMMLHILKS